MAFISMVFVFLFLCLLGLGLLGLILLIIGLVKRAKNKKIMKKSKAPIVLIVLGILFLLPAMLVIIVLIVGGVNSNLKNKKNLNYQVKYGTAKDVEKLLKSGVSPECVRDNYDENVVAENREYTVLSYLCHSHDVPEYAEKIKLLIDYGADVNRTVCWCEYTPEEHLGQQYDEDRGYNDGCGQTPLMMACESGSYDAVKLLLENGADVNARDYCGETALICAAWPTGYSDSLEDQEKIAKLLLEYGADKDVSGKYSGTALERASERDWPEMVSILTE
ncbi:MAG: DUF1418 family protein [Clostridiales bacterium]|nr:DUF1418 family protein [Clostridiales bacterium]